MLFLADVDEYNFTNADFLEQLPPPPPSKKSPLYMFYLFNYTCPGLFSTFPAQNSLALANG